MTRQDPDAPQNQARAPGPGNGREPMDAKAAAAFFARVSRDLMEEQAEIPMMQRIAERAVQIVPGCDHCTISVRRHQRVEPVASTSALAEKCDELQYDLEEGPCLDTVWASNSYLIDDTAAETRWPRWSPQVATQGIGSVLCIRLSTTTNTVGALNLYAEKVHGFSTEDVDLAAIYALHATNAMNSALLIKGLQTAVQSRHLIGVAQGILMHNYGIDMEQAFDVLRRYSSHRNIKLREVAEHVVQAGDLPGWSLLRD
ncbi:MAG: GAF and ANTAR domain-containing protein [Marmoricola sp.]